VVVSGTVPAAINGPLARSPSRANQRLEVAAPTRPAAAIRGAICRAATITLAVAIARQAPHRPPDRPAAIAVAARLRIDARSLIDAACGRALHLDAADVLRRREV
jgi:hypothetical protein